MTTTDTVDPLVVRAARRDDMAAVVAIYNDAVLRTTATFDYEPRELAQQEALFDDKVRDGYGFLVADDPAVGVLGFATYGLFRTRPGWRFACEHSVYVAASSYRERVTENFDRLTDQRWRQEIARSAAPAWMTPGR